MNELELERHVRLATEGDPGSLDAVIRHARRTNNKELERWAFTIQVIGHLPPRWDEPNGSIFLGQFGRYDLWYSEDDRELYARFAQGGMYRSRFSVYEDVDDTAVESMRRLEILEGQQLFEVSGHLGSFVMEWNEGQGTNEYELASRATSGLPVHREVIESAVDYIWYALQGDDDASDEEAYENLQELAEIILMEDPPWLAEYPS